MASVFRHQALAEQRVPFVDNGYLAWEPTAKL
jgi:hypothetical protein